MTRNINEEVKASGLSIARQLEDGLLDAFPKDKAAARERLRALLDSGDITNEDLSAFSRLWQ